MNVSNNLEKDNNCRFDIQVIVSSASWFTSRSKVKVHLFSFRDHRRTLQSEQNVNSNVSSPRCTCRMPTTPVSVFGLEMSPDHRRSMMLECVNSNSDLPRCSSSRPISFPLDNPITTLFSSSACAYWNGAFRVGVSMYSHPWWDPNSIFNCASRELPLLMPYTRDGGGLWVVTHTHASNVTKDKTYCWGSECTRKDCRYGNAMHCSNTCHHE